MTILIFSALVGLAALVAGFLGALTGLGGGVVPLLTLVFGVEIRYAMGASLVSVIATSSGAAVAYVKERSEMAPIYDPDTVTTLRGTATAVTVVPARGGGMGGVHVTLSSDGQAMDVAPWSCVVPRSRGRRRLQGRCGRGQRLRHRFEW